MQVEKKHNRGGEEDVTSERDRKERQDCEGGGSRTGRKEERRGGEEGGGDESCQSGDKRAEEGCGAAAENMKNVVQGSCCIQILAIKISPPQTYSF